MKIIENDNNDSDNNSANDDKDNNNDDNYIPVDSPLKGPIILCFDATFVESKNKSSFRWFETRCPSHDVTVMWDIYATPSYLYCCKQLWINCFIYVHLYSKLCKMQLAVSFGNTAIQSAADSPHKRPINLCLDVFFVVSLNKLLKQQSICWCWKKNHVLFRIYFH